MVSESVRRSLTLKHKCLGHVQLLRIQDWNCFCSLANQDRKEKWCTRSSDPENYKTLYDNAHVVWPSCVQFCMKCRGIATLLIAEPNQHVTGSWCEWLIQFELNTIASRQGLVSNIERSRTVQNQSHISIILRCESTRVPLWAQILSERSKPTCEWIQNQKNFCY